MARDREKARPHVFPPTSKARGMEETVTDRKKADERTRKSHIGRWGSDTSVKLYTGGGEGEVTKGAVESWMIMEQN